MIDVVHLRKLKLGESALHSILPPLMEALEESYYFRSFLFPCVSLLWPVLTSHIHLCYCVVNAQEWKSALFMAKQSGNTITCPPYVIVKMAVAAKVLYILVKKRPDSHSLTSLRMPPQRYSLLCQNKDVLMAHNWQKWKRVFLTCHCHKIYRHEAVGLKKLQKYLKNYDICENVKFGAKSWKFDILSITV